MNFEVSKISTIEMASPVLLLLWATWWALFDASESSPSYEYAKFLSNFEWAVVFLVAGGFKIFSVISKQLILRRVGIILSICLWLVMLVIFAFSNYQSHAVPTCIYFTFVNILALEKLFSPAK